MSILWLVCFRDCMAESLLDDRAAGGDRLRAAAAKAAEHHCTTFFRAVNGLCGAMAKTGPDTAEARVRAGGRRMGVEVLYGAQGWQFPHGS